MPSKPCPPFGLSRRRMLACVGMSLLATSRMSHADQGGVTGIQKPAIPEQPRETPRPIQLAGPTKQTTESVQPWLRKTLKDNMLKVADGKPQSDRWLAKMELAKQAGFEGVEISTKDSIDTDAATRAAQRLGLVIDGTVGGYHWSVRHTDPDPDVRKQAQRLLTSSLRQTAELGANTFLIVPGHGRDGTPDEVKARATSAIESALPLAEELNIAILIENVWNHFLYTHDGDANQSVEPLADFVDSFGSPLIGVQFDLGNHWKYADVATWIRTLGSHIQKLDIKGFSRASDR
ncbi:MAG: sugar phosphate isomerase/epimerase family protein, partial [Planctomycetota bacterium]